MPVFNAAVAWARLLVREEGHRYCGGVIGRSGGRADRPETRYVAVGDGEVAYKVFGEGPFDIVYSMGVLQIDAALDYEPFVEALSRLAAGGRLVVFDRRGMGSSDRVPGRGVPTWEHWTEDLTAVLDAIGSERAVICAESEGGPIAVLFAAMQPERVRSLILINTSARHMAADDYAIGVERDVVELSLAVIQGSWGTPDLVGVAFPSMAHDREFASWITRSLRAALTPHTAGAYFRYIFESLDVRQALPLIQAPTLILHNRSNPFVPVSHGRYLADHIAGAQFVELEGSDTYIFPADWARATTEIAEFVTGERPYEVDRLLTTVLFTDIVGSTELAASLGDNSWRTLLDRHDRAVREQLRRFRGQEINTTGDGFVASFDGPARAIRCAQAIVESAPVGIRAGLHTGECEVRGNDLSGLAVHIAARVGSAAHPGEVLVSSTVKDLVAGSGITFGGRGTHSLKGVPEEWNLYAVEHA